MTMRIVCAAMGMAAAAFLASPALAEASRLNIIIGGEAYDGPPRFEVSFDGEVLGVAAVDAAIDTAKAGRFADAADKTPYVRSFEFAIPEYRFRPDGEVRVRLVNEAYGGDGSDRDRNLFLAAVTVNGGVVTVSGLVTATENGFKPNHTVGEFLLLADGNEEGVSPAPRGGWPSPREFFAMSEPRLMPEFEPASSRQPVANVTALTAPTIVIPTPEEVTVGSIEMTAAGEPPACQLDQIYNVLGFNENSNDLTPRLMQRLDQILEDIGEERCRVLVTGYSSTVGSHATNALFAVERAQNVLRYLRDNGLRYEKASAAGGGATEQFGPLPSDNRRVVITVLPM
jgi:outer membrane protein OmpA-like peptidoglycan-associated protein